MKKLIFILIITAQTLAQANSYCIGFFYNTIGGTPLKIMDSATLIYSKKKNTIKYIHRRQFWPFDVESAVFAPKAGMLKETVGLNYSKHEEVKYMATNIEFFDSNGNMMGNFDLPDKSLQVLSRAKFNTQKLHQIVYMNCVK